MTTQEVAGARWESVGSPRPCGALGLHQGQQTIESITSTRDRRTELVAEITRTERALEEAIESLGVDPGVDGG